MAYQKFQNQISQDLGYEYIEIEFILEDVKDKESPVEEKPKHAKYALSAPLSKKELRADRKSRRKSSIQFNRPVSTFSVAQSRISY